MTTVLHIDDNAMNRKLARDHFNADGFRTVQGRVLAARRENSLIAAAGWGRGIYRSIVAYRADLAARRGFRFLQVDASAESRPILQRLGFVAVTTATPFVWTSPSAT